MQSPSKINGTYADRTYSFEVRTNFQQNKKEINSQVFEMKQNNKTPRKDSRKSSLEENKFRIKINKIQKKGFDPFSIPPNLDICYFHKVVTQFGKPIENNFSQYEGLKNNILDETHSPISLKRDSQRKDTLNQVAKKLCPCCGQQPKQQLPICCRTQQIYNINESLGFYFTYIKASCFMLFLITTTVGAYALEEVIVNCQSQKDCITVYGIPISKFHIFFTDLLIILNGLIIAIMYILLSYLYYINAHIHKKIFLNHKKPSDYCVLISGVDHQKVTGQNIIEYFQSYQIVDILYTHQIEKYIKKLSQKSILIAKKNLHYRRGEDEKLKKIDHEIDKLNNYLLHIKNKLNLKQEKQLRTDKIIIKFKTPQEKLRFQKNYKESMYQTIIHSFCGGSLIEINQNKMYVQPLGEPHEIVWENLQLKSKQRYLRILMGNILTILILCCCYMLVAFLTRVEKDYNGTKDIFLSLTFSIVIQVTNFLLDILIERLTDWQKRYTLTGKIRIILIKNFISFFLNTTLIPFSLFLFAWGSPDEDDLIRNIFTLFLMSNFISPFVSLYIRPRALYAFYKKKKILKQGKDSLETQIKANQYFEKVDFDLNARYSVVIELLGNAVFYAAVFPVGLIITFFGLILAYWTSKWWLIRYCSIPKFSHRLGRLVNDITATFPCIFAFGYAFNLIMASGEAEFDTRIPIIIAILTIPISLMFVLFGNKIAEKFVARQYKSLQKLYNMEEQIQMNGSQRRKVADYSQLNPTTFIHSDVHSHIKQIQFGGIWNHLESYAIDKQAGYLRRDSNLSSEKHSNYEQVVNHNQKQ